MKNNFKLLGIFLTIILLVMMFSACTDDTGVTVYGNIDSPEISDVKIEVNIDTKTELNTETDVEASADTVTQTKDVTEQITEEITEMPETEEEKEQVTETLPDETTSAPKTEKETEDVTIEKGENKSVNEYLLNTNSKKFHHMSCKSGQKTKEVNRAYHTGTREEVIAKGYSPCKVCNP